MKNYFKYANEHAYMFSQEENKIGVILVDQKNREYYYSNTNCINPIIECITQQGKKKQNRTDFKNSKMYVTSEILDEETVNIINEKNLKCYMLGDSERKINDNIEVLKKSDYVEDIDKWWTDKLYEEAYEIVKDRKFPVTIPGYNRPSLPTLVNLGVKDYNDEVNWPFFIIVRESQEEMYKEATKNYKYVTIKSFPDDIINNAGAVRRTTQKWLNSIGVKATFQMDDDVQFIGYSVPGLKSDGYPKSAYKSCNSARVLAMWQIAMEKAMASEEVCISCGQQIAFSWKEDYCQSERSCRFMRGPMTQVVCFNIEKLCKEGIYHNNNKDVGFDDIDFTIRVIDSGNRTCLFPWIVYGCEALGGGEGNVVSKDKLQERFKNNQDKLKSIHLGKQYVNFRIKRDLDQVVIKWSAARRYCAEKLGYNVDEFVHRSEYDIWDNGKLLEEAKNNKYERFGEYRYE